MTGLTGALRVVGPVHVSLVLVTVAAIGLWGLAGHPGQGHRFAGAYSWMVVTTSVSGLMLMVVEVDQLDLRGGGALGLVTLLLAVAGRRRYAAVVARRDEVLDRLRRREDGLPPARLGG